MFTYCWAHHKSKKNRFAQKLFLEVSFKKPADRKCCGKTLFFHGSLWDPYIFQQKKTPGSQARNHREKSPPLVQVGSFNNSLDAINKISSFTPSVPPTMAIFATEFDGFFHPPPAMDCVFFGGSTQTLIGEEDLDDLCMKMIPIHFERTNTKPPYNAVLRLAATRFKPKIVGEPKLGNVSKNFPEFDSVLLDEMRP